MAERNESCDDLESFLEAQVADPQSCAGGTSSQPEAAPFECPQGASTSRDHAHFLSLLEHSEDCPSPYLEYPAPDLQNPQPGPSSYLERPGTSSERQPQPFFHPAAATAVVPLLQVPLLVESQGTSSASQEPSGFSVLLYDFPQSVPAVLPPQEDLDVIQMLREGEAGGLPQPAPACEGFPVAQMLFPDLGSQSGEPVVYQAMQPQEPQEPQAQEPVVVPDDDDVVEVPEDPREGSSRSEAPPSSSGAVCVGAPVDQRLARELEDMNFGEYVVKIPCLPKPPQKPTPAKPPRGSKKIKTLSACALCPKQFESKYKLKLHLNSHTGRRPFVCAVCNRGFFRGPNLHAHSRIHKGPGNFRCRHCDHHFWHRSDLEVHLISGACVRLDVHRGQDDLSCQTCGRGPFPTVASFRAHARQHNKGQGSLCPVCYASVQGQKGRLLVAHVKECHREYYQQCLNDGAEELPKPK